MNHFSSQLLMNQSLFSDPLRSYIRPLESDTSDITDTYSRREISPKMKNLLSGVGALTGGIASKGSDQSHTIREGLRNGMSMLGP
jgi:hypothetical protein